MPAPHARLLAITDQCVSRCAQVTQLPAAASSSQSLIHTEDAHAHSETAVRHASIEPIDAALAMPVQASATGVDGAVHSATCAKQMPSSVSTLATLNVVCSTLRFFWAVFNYRTRNAVTLYVQILEYEARISFKLLN